MVTKDIVAAVGNFDGVHPGHQFLITETKKFAASLNAAPGVVLFEPHPRRYFRPNDPPFLLTSSRHRDELLTSLGVEKIMALTFNHGLAQHSPEEFVRDVLAQKLKLCGVVAGADFRFGKDRAGDAQSLETLGRANGLAVRITDLVSIGDMAGKYGSSGVRAAIAEGDVALAAKLLGRCWSVRGVVQQGEKRGRTIGFPTANFTLGEIIEPRFGVYATRAHHAGRVHNAVSNFGRRPTVGASAPLLETYLLNFSGNLYGAEIEVEFVSFIRDERKFDGLDALKNQIAADCIEAARLLA